MDIQKIKTTYNISRKVVEQFFPEEVIWFDELWNAFEPILSGKFPNDLSIPDVEESAVFLGPERLHLLQLPSYSLLQCIASGVRYTAVNGKYPNAEEFKKLVSENVSKCCNIPEEKLKTISQAAWQLLIEELSCLIPLDSELEKYHESETEEIGRKESVTAPWQETSIVYDYIVYSHENEKNPKLASKDKVKELRSVPLKEKGKRFDLFLDYENSRLLVKGIPKSVSRSEIQQKFLAILLAHVGDRCTFYDLQEFVWEKDVEYNLIHQTKNRVLKLTDNLLEPFIEAGSRETHKDNESGDKIKDVEVYYVRREDSDGNILRYCLIIPKYLAKFFVIL